MPGEAAPPPEEEQPSVPQGADRRIGEWATADRVGAPAGFPVGGAAARRVDIEELAERVYRRLCDELLRSRELG